SGSFQALLTSVPSEEPSEFFIRLLGVAPDLRHIVVTTPAALTPGATQQSRGNLYDWAGGQFQPVNVLPGVTSGETASGGAFLGMGNDENHTISNDGSRVFWSQPETKTLFLRESVGTEPKTIQVDASHGGEDLGGRGVFKTASASGSRVFFTDRNRLTPNSTAGGSSAHEDLYLLDLE